MTRATASHATDYPFQPRYAELPGGRMHYVDEGAGPAVVLVHGTPTWSYLYRHLIRALRGSHRVIAPDHLGFGRSDKAPDADYRPATHARNLTALLDELSLGEIVLVVHDFGGPIGLSHAVDRPDSIRALILFNTWMWSLAGTSAERLSHLLGGRIGRLLYTWLNVSPRVLLKAAFADRRALTRDVHARYLEPFPTADTRVAPWVLARELAASGAWYQDLWERRDRIGPKPALLLWGMQDPAFGGDALDRWTRALPLARSVEMDDVGHFVMEEAPHRTVQEVTQFLASL